VPATLLDELVDLLDLERLEADLFRGRQPATTLQRVFGGQVAGQALVAAGRTVAPDRPVHSLHSYFLRPGDPQVPIVYSVERTRDGRSFTTRRVVALQHGRTIFTLTASFAVVEDGPDHQDPMPAAPDPESLPPLHELLSDYADELGGWFVRPRPIDLRYVGKPPLVAIQEDGPQPPSNDVWLRADGRLPDDPMLHACVLTYASDSTLLDSVLLPHRLAVGHGLSGGGSLASLDHAVWFHRPFRADDWLLYSQHSPSAHGARGLATGRIFSRDGQLVASVVQEGLVRPSRAG